jgi:phage-related minor tail protein
MTERNLTIRLSVKDSEVVRRALEGLGADGQKALERITQAAGGTGPGLEALNEITSAGRGAMEEYGHHAGAVGTALMRLGPVGLAAAAGVGSLMAAIHGGLHEFEMAEQSSLRLEAVFKATGNTAGVTAGEIGDLADELEASTMASAEAIKDAASVLATFRSVSGDTFTRALRLGQDMAATFGGDVRSAMVQLGKALEDPTEGLTALRRVGVTFTATEREMIAGMVAAGDAATAQKVILDALETQVGGAGEGEASGLTGATKHLHDAWGNLLEEFVRTTGVGRDTTSFLRLMTSLAKDATSAIAEIPLEAKIAAAEAKLDEASRGQTSTYRA